MFRTSGSEHGVSRLSTMFRAFDPFKHGMNTMYLVQIQQPTELFRRLSGAVRLLTLVGSSGS